MDGPYLTCALFCERVLQERDDVLSAIRVVDKLLVQSVPSGETPGPAVRNITLLIALKAGDYIGSGKIVIEGRTPAGKPMTPPKVEMPAELKGGNSGYNLIVHTGIPFNEHGTYWFDVSFEGRLLTRIPMSVELSAPPTAIPPKPRSEKKRGRKQQLN